MTGTVQENPYAFFGWAPALCTPGLLAERNLEESPVHLRVKDAAGRTAIGDRVAAAVPDRDSDGWQITAVAASGARTVWAVPDGTAVRVWAALEGIERSRAAVAGNASGRGPVTLVGDPAGCAL